MLVNDRVLGSSFHADILIQNQTFILKCKWYENNGILDTALQHGSCCLQGLSGKVSTSNIKIWVNITEEALVQNLSKINSILLSCNQEAISPYLLQNNRSPALIPAFLKRLMTKTQSWNCGNTAVTFVRHDRLKRRHKLLGISS